MTTPQTSNLNGETLIYNANAIVLALTNSVSTEAAAERMAALDLSDEVVGMATVALEDADEDVRDMLRPAVSRARDIAWENTQTPATGNRLDDRVSTLKTAVERCATWTPTEWAAVRMALKTATRNAQEREAALCEVPRDKARVGARFFRGHEEVVVVGVWDNGSPTRLPRVKVAPVAFPA